MVVLLTLRCIRKRETWLKKKKKKEGNFSVDVNKSESEQDTKSSEKELLSLANRITGTHSTHNLFELARVTPWRNRQYNQEEDWRCPCSLSSLCNFFLLLLYFSVLLKRKIKKRRYKRTVTQIYGRKKERVRVARPPISILSEHGCALNKVLFYLIFLIVLCSHIGPLQNVSNSR